MLDPPAGRQRINWSAICSGVWRRIGGSHAGQCVFPPGVKEAEVVIDVGDRPQRAARIGGPGLLINRDRRRQALDQVDIGPLELVEELAGVTRDAFGYAAAPRHRSCRTPASSCPGR